MRKIVTRNCSLRREETDVRPRNTNRFCFRASAATVPKLPTFQTTGGASKAISYQTWKHRSVGPDPQGGIAGESQHPGHFLRLSSGTIVLGYGNQTMNSGVDAHSSTDDGTTWSAPYRVLDCAGDLGYPSSVQRADGQVVTAYYASRIHGHQDYHMGVVTWDTARLILDSHHEN